jgi:hypothetical protein
MASDQKRAYEDLRAAATYAVQVWLLMRHDQTAVSAKQFLEEAMTRLRSTLEALEPVDGDPGPA